MNKILGILLLIFSFSSNANYTGLQLTSDGDTKAIAGLIVSGQTYDVSFDGSFGITDTLTIGLNPFDAYMALHNVVNIGLNGYTRYPLLTFTNGPSGELGLYFQVKESATQAYTGEYGAGYVDKGLLPIDETYLVYFRVAIPNSLKDLIDPLALNPVIPNVPEPSEYALLLAGLAIIGYASRRKQ